LINATSDRTIQAVVLIVGSVLLFSASDAVVKAVSADYSIWQIYTARSAFSVVTLVLFLAPGGLGRSVQIAQPWVLLRSFLFVGAFFAYYTALPSIDLSVAATAFYTAPLFIALLSALVAGERVGAGRWTGIAIGFFGVLVILRPGTDQFSVLALLPIAAAVLYAVSAIVTRTRCASENPIVLGLSIHVCLLAVGIIGTAVIAILQPASSDPFLLGPWTAMDGLDWSIMAGLGILQGVAAVSVARAYQWGAPAVVGTFDYAYLIFAALWGMLFFAETITALTVAGMLLIVVAGVIVLRQPDGHTAGPGSAQA
jgi:drug/metabolite transporter (DMT)-like permease